MVEHLQRNLDDASVAASEEGHGRSNSKRCNTGDITVQREAEK
jgi:hypothetical protein